MTREPPPPHPLPDVTASLPASYRALERVHARAWLTRLLLPLGIACTNGGPWLDVDWLPRLAGTDALSGPLSGSAAAWWNAAMLAGMILCTLDAACLRVAAKGVLVRKTTVTTEGVYSRLRHPYYAACLAAGAGLLAAGWPGFLAGLVWTAVAIPVFYLTARGEEAGLRAVHGRAWEEYAARVPMVGPWFPESLRGVRQARWENLVREGEPPRLLRFVAIPLAILAFRTGGTAGTVLVSAAGGLWLTALVLHRSLRESGARARDGVSSRA